MSRDRIAGAPGKRLLEISFQPLLKNVFPEQVDFVDTRLRWRDVRSQEASSEPLARRWSGLMREFARGLRLAWKQDYDAVVTRCLGPVNSYGQPWLAHAGRIGMGWVLEAMVRLAARGSGRPLVVIDQTDHVTIHPRDRRLVTASALYFKRELADNIWHSLETVLARGACAGTARYTPEGIALLNKVRPFSLGIDGARIVPPLPNQAKAYDLFYSGEAAGIPARTALPAILDLLKAQGWKVFAPRERLPVEKFNEAIRQSRFCLSPGGTGWDCYRHYEVVALGSVPIMNFRPLRAWEPFQHGLECFYYDPQDDLAASLVNWLRWPNEQLDEMAAAAQRKLRKFHTFDALARYVWREIEQPTVVASQ